MWLWIACGGLGLMVPPMTDPDPANAIEAIETWRRERESKLKADNSWLTLCGRYPLSPGESLVGTGAAAQVRFPPALAGVGPEILGRVILDASQKTVTFHPAPGVRFIAGESAEGPTFDTPRVLKTGTNPRDWVGLGRFRFHVFEQGEQYILRLADNESPLRKQFPGCVWYPVDLKYQLEAEFVPYPQGKTLPIVNVLEETNPLPSPGFLRLKLSGTVYELDLLEGTAEEYFLIFRDGTSGETTYGASRFLYVRHPVPGESRVVVDFNRAYNPPCAFSEFTTCPLPPARNRLPVRIEAGEKAPRKPTDAP